MTLNNWAIKWNIPIEAVTDLRVMMGAINTDPPVLRGISEAANVNNIRVQASQLGLRLWRNNVGATMDDRGNFIRYGLANDSKAMNKKIKSSDLIGIRPITITPAHIGQVIGQFVAYEVKASTWHYTGNEHEQAQLRFLELVLSLGGDARFLNSMLTD